jgi:hypothetical protein
MFHYTLLENKDLVIEINKYRPYSSEPPRKLKNLTISG